MNPVVSHERQLGSVMEVFNDVAANKLLRCSY